MLCFETKISFFKADSHIEMIITGKRMAPTLRLFIVPLRDRMVLLFAVAIKLHKSRVVIRILLVFMEREKVLFSRSARLFFAIDAWRMRCFVMFFARSTVPNNKR